MSQLQSSKLYERLMSGLTLPFLKSETLMRPVASAKEYLEDQSNEELFRPADLPGDNVLHVVVA